jgi:DNA-binding transcriptional ArsR family regulator/2-polyprenyl-3-methyl-5-hydroxy-6-metoxy-1,4-benzoquinol methylase
VSETAAPTIPAARALAQLLVGNQLQQAIHVAARLRIADRLADGPRSAEWLADAAGAHPGALRRLLRALAGAGIFVEDDDGRFALTPLAEPLVSGPRSALPFALWAGGVSYQAFGALEHTVRTGEPAFEQLFGTEFFAYLAAHPESGDVFDAMMARHTEPLAPAIARYDFGDVETVVDVGGGRGELLASVLSERPALRGVLFEQPRLLADARRHLARAGVADRCEVVSGDMLVAVPPGDVYLLKSVLHGLRDADAVQVLVNCRHAIRPHGMVLLAELVLPPGAAPSPGRLMDLLMLVGCHGRERTAAEFATLLEAAGLRLTAVVPTKHAYSLVEGRVA